MLYSLIFTDIELSYDNFTENFLIGVFETEEKAIETAQYYLKTIKGFCDFPFTYRVEEKIVIDVTNDKSIDEVWLVQGWNINENFDEIDVVDSQFLLTEEQANVEFHTMQSKYKRDEWVVDKYVIGELNFGEGFVRL